MTAGTVKGRWPWWAMIPIGIVGIVVVLATFSAAQDVVDARATECEDFKARLADPNITVGEIERLRIEHADCYPSDGAWPGLLRPRPREQRGK